MPFVLSQVSNCRLQTDDITRIRHPGLMMLQNAQPHSENDKCLARHKMSRECLARHENVSCIRDIRETFPIFQNVSRDIKTAKKCLVCYSARHCFYNENVSLWRDIFVSRETFCVFPKMSRVSRDILRDICWLDITHALLGYLGTKLDTQHQK